MKNKFKLSSLALLGATLTLPSTLLAESYIVLTKGNKIDTSLIQEIEAQGATVTAQLPQVGMLMIDSDNGDIRERLSSNAKIQTTFSDLNLQYVTPSEQTLPEISFGELSINPPASGNDDFYFDLQWGHDAVNAPEAWQAGVKGQGVRVAVLDSGIMSTHPDLAPNLNTALSTSFINGEAYNSPAGSHGTHVAGTIAAADNAFGTIGVAPEAEIVTVKVLSGVSGSGPFSSIFQGMVYAADIDADVINMSLGADIPRNCTFDGVHQPAKDCADLFTALNRVTHYVNKKGSVIIAAAGNDGRDLNHDATLKAFPAEGNHVISVSSLGPVGWGLDTSANLDVMASYSNYGKNGIDIAGPGGNYDLFFTYGNAPCNGPVLPGFTCYVYDMVLSTTPGGWGWNAGTSMASPHVAGIAALIISENGGSMSPVEVERELIKRSEDINQPGKDDETGHGRASSGY
ncbi:S8 family peptidase [Kangiella sp. M94]